MSRQILVPIRTAPGLNVREHWRKRAARVRREREATAWVLSTIDRPATPCAVTLTRLGPSNGLDDDNLPGALKAVRDAVAEWIGVDDRHRDVVRYLYRQQRAAGWCVEINFGPMPKEAA